MIIYRRCSAQAIFPVYLLKWAQVNVKIQAYSLTSRMIQVFDFLRDKKRQQIEKLIKTKESAITKKGK